MLSARVRSSRCPLHCPWCARRPVISLARARPAGERGASYDVGSFHAEYADESAAVSKKYSYTGLPYEDLDASTDITADPLVPTDKTGKPLKWDDNPATRRR